MGWISRVVYRQHTRFFRLALPAMVLGLTSAAESAFAADPIHAKSPAPASVEMTFTKGDTRNGSRIQLRVAGDSLYYRETLYSPDATPKESRKNLYLFGVRRRALMGVLGELPRYPTFGSCYGKDMRFYLVETPTGKFYRSLPEKSSKCYLEESGIWSLFQDLDNLISPPTELEFQEPTAS